MSQILPSVITAGSNATRFWGMDVDERVRRIAAAARLPFGAPQDGAAALIVNRAFVFDPAWLRELAGRPGAALTIAGCPVIAHGRDEAERLAVLAAIAADAPLAADAGLNMLAFEQGATIVNAQLRKREQPFALRLIPATMRAAERASYFGAYKGVTDLLTKYLWPEWALVLTRIAARIGMSPNMVTGIGALGCIAATFAFAFGHYWLGMAFGLSFMVLDTVDGKLARCTITSSRWGNIFDHGIDLIHPPFWWIAWAIGLSAYGRPLALSTEAWVEGAIIGGYVAQRVIEGAFMRMFGMHVHVWRRIDSRFRLITARRNPNMVILFAAMLAARPDIGLVAVAGWTLASLAVHTVQFGQALRERAQGRVIRSWLG